MRRILVSSPVLSFSSSEGSFILDTDASDHSIGAILSQCQGESERVIAYFSHVLSKAERNYCIIRQEFLAVTEAVEFFHRYLFGRKFLLRTDHVSLRWLISFQNVEGQLARWLNFVVQYTVEQYNFEILYRSGKSHRNSDRLSRYPCSRKGLSLLR